MFEGRHHIWPHQQTLNSLRRFCWSGNRYRLFYSIELVKAESISFDHFKIAFLWLRIFTIYNFIIFKCCFVPFDLHSLLLLDNFPLPWVRSWNLLIDFFLALFHKVFCRLVIFVLIKCLNLVLIIFFGVIFSWALRLLPVFKNSPFAAIERRLVCCCFHFISKIYLFIALIY